MPHNFSNTGPKFVHIIETKVLKSSLQLFINQSIQQNIEIYKALFKGCFK